MANIVLSNTDYNVVGTRPVRPDGADKVTGRAKYGGDFQMTGLLHGQVLRSPHAHARIKSIDTSKAEAYPGVRAVVTVKDLPISQMENPDQGMRHASDNVLARQRFGPGQGALQGPPYRWGSGSESPRCRGRGRAD